MLVSIAILGSTSFSGSRSAWYCGVSTHAWQSTTPNACTTHYIRFTRKFPIDVSLLIMHLFFSHFTPDTARQHSFIFSGLCRGSLHTPYSCLLSLSALSSGCNVSQWSPYLHPVLLWTGEGVIACHSGLIVGLDAWPASSDLFASSVAHACADVPF